MMSPPKLQFCEKGVNTFAKVYENIVLEPVVKPLNNIMFSNEHWNFKQDLAPARKAYQGLAPGGFRDFITPGDSR